MSLQFRSHSSEPLTRRFQGALKRAALCAAALCCGLGAAASEAAALRIGTLPASDAVLLYAAESEGCFTRAGLEVTLVPFRSAVELGAAMRAGELDGHYGDLMTVLLQYAGGIPQAVAVTATRAHAGTRNFALLASPKAAERLQNFDDLRKGAPVETAMSSATIIDYLLTRMEETENLPADRLKKIEIKQIPIRLQLLLAGKMDTALLPEPLASVVEAKGGRTLWDDSNLAEPLAVVAFKKTAVTEAVVTALRGALSEAAHRIESDPVKFRRLMVEKRLLPPAGAERYVMPKWSVFGTKDGLAPLPTEAEVERVGAWMLGKGMVKALPPARDVVFP